jgi:hypothetical protein
MLMSSLEVSGVFVILVAALMEDRRGQYDSGSEPKMMA